MLRKSKALGGVRPSYLKQSFHSDTRLHSTNRLFDRGLKFFNVCASKADNADRDIDLYHWSSAKFCSTWRDTVSVLVARGRAQVGVRAAKSDWSKRIRDFQYMDYDDYAAHR